MICKSKSSMKITQFQIENGELFILLDSGELLRKNLKQEEKWTEIAIPEEYIPIEEQGPKMVGEEIKMKRISPEKQQDNLVI